MASTRDPGPIGRLGRFAATHAAPSSSPGRLSPSASVSSRHGSRRRSPAPAGRPTARSRSGPRTDRTRLRRRRRLRPAGCRPLPAPRRRRPRVRTHRRPVERVLAADPAVRTVAAPARAARSPPTATPRSSSAPPPRPERDGRRRRRPQGRIAAAAAPGVEANLTGAAGMWSDFNEANREAMLKSELLSWPVTLAILVLAFGSLVAAGLPLMLTIIGLIASAGVLYLGTKLAPISIWAMNFALMFALALGIDYALFVVMRFRSALFGQAEKPGGGGRRDDGHGRQGGPLLRPDRDDLAGGGDAGAEPGLPLGRAGNHRRGALRPRGDPDPAAGGAGQARTADRQARPALGHAASTARPASPAGASASGAGPSSSAASPWSRCWCWRCRSSA